LRALEHGADGGGWGVRQQEGLFLAADVGSDARATITGVPMDVTTSFRRGCATGPAHVRAMSWALEEHSAQVGRSLEDVALRDGGDLRPLVDGVESWLATTEELVARSLEGDVLPVLIGGEHLLTLGAVRAAARAHPGLAVIQFDAHADLRDTYSGLHLSHATVMRRVSEIVGPKALYQLGVRSVGDREAGFTRRTNFFPGDLTAAAAACRRLSGGPVWVTIDIDVVDPAFAPGTGCPEPGGPSSRELLESLYLLRGLNVVGLDVVEVSEPQDRGGITGLLAARVIRDAVLLFARGS